MSDTHMVCHKRHLSLSDVHMASVTGTQDRIVIILFQIIQEYLPDFLSPEHTLGFFQEETKFCFKLS